jgi:hypothetical protein
MSSLFLQNFLTKKRKRKKSPRYGYFLKLSGGEPDRKLL